MNRLAILALASCTIGEGEPPSAEPPTWGLPISGGTMLVTRDGERAVIADSDRDRVLLLSLSGTVRVTREYSLSPGSEPGRVVEDGAGRIHVVLRGTNELWTLADDAPTRRSVCAEPRGVAWDAATDLVHVACASGGLVSMLAEGGPVTRTLELDRDLRDVLVVGTTLVVTRFRSAEVLTLASDGSVIARVAPSIVQRADTSGGSGGDSPAPADPLLDAVPTVAWRTIALPDGRVVVAHQRKIDAPLDPHVGYFRDQCIGPVESALSAGVPGAPLVAATPSPIGSLVVDIAVAPGGEQLAVVSAGRGIVSVIPTSSLDTPDEEKCGHAKTPGGTFADELGAPTSLAFRPNGELLVYYPELPALVIHTLDSSASRAIRLPGELGYDSGRGLFHQETRAGLACASCHPEGREDGQTWLVGTQRRRTQSLAGLVTSRTPYHWDGGLADLEAVMLDVFSQRMGGGEVTRSQRTSLGPWLDRIPAPAPRVVDAEAASRGQALFFSPELGCVGCHAGPLYTMNTLVDVGTGGVFKTPGLVGIGGRAPFFHDGCAATLADVFGTCGTPDRHGHTSQLSSGERADLVMFLESI